MKKLLLALPFVFALEEANENYSCGRIDVYGTDNLWGDDDISVPPMRSEDWNQFGNWLIDFKTDRMWTLDELTTEYEKTNPPIRWDLKED